MAVVADVVVPVVVDASFVDDDATAADVVGHFANVADAVRENVVDVAHGDVDFVEYDFA